LILFESIVRYIYLKTVAPSKDCIYCYYAICRQN